MSDSKFDFDEFIKNDFQEFSINEKPTVNPENSGDEHEMRNDLNNIEQDNTSPTPRNYDDNDHSDSDQTDSPPKQNSGKDTVYYHYESSDFSEDEQETTKDSEILENNKTREKPNSSSRVNFQNNPNTRKSSKNEDQKPSPKKDISRDGRQNSKPQNSHRGSYDGSSDTDDDESSEVDENGSFSPVAERPQKVKQENSKQTPAKSTKRSHSQPSKKNHNSAPPKRFGSEQKNRGGGRGNSKMNGSQTTAERKQVMNRVLSANRNKARTMHNVIAELQREIESLTTENRDLKRAAYLQGREIRKLDNAEAELPSLLKKHSGEIRALQEKFRKQKQQSDKAREDLKKRETELYKTKEKLQKYESVIKEKNLGERNALNKKLQELQKELEDKDKTIAELSRSVQLHEKVRARELKEKNEKYRRAVDEMKRLEQEQKELLKRLRDKEKALEVTNIYSQRLNQRRGSKETDYGNALFSPSDPVPPPIRRHQEELETEYAQSVRGQSVKKAFITEGSATREQKRSKMETIDFEGDDYKSPKSSPRKNNKETDKSPRNDKSPAVKTMVGEAKNENEENNRDKNDELDRRITELKRREDEERKEEVKRKLAAEKELEEGLARVEEERKQREAEKEKKLKEEEERRKQAEEEERKKLEAERKDREVMRKKKEEEEARKNNKQEEEQDEFERRKAELYEKRKKKELLLAKMQAIDRGENPDAVSEPTNKSEKQKKKPIFLENNSTSKPRETTKEDLWNGTYNEHDDLFSGNSNRRDSWEFRKTDENLHKGLPAHEPSPTVRRRNTQDKDDYLSSASSGKGSRHRNNQRQDSNLSGNKKSRRRDILDGDDEDNVYSPTGLKDTNNKNARNNGLFNEFDDPFQYDKSTHKKNSQKTDLFSQFDDPFKSSTDTKKNKKKNTIIFSSDEEDDVDSYVPNQTRKIKGPNHHYAPQNGRTPLSKSFSDLDFEETILT